MILDHLRFFGWRPLEFASKILTNGSTIVEGDYIFDVMSERGPEVLDDVIAWSLAWLLRTL
jgi:hypothetical protein